MKNRDSLKITALYERLSKDHLLYKGQSGYGETGKADDD